MFTNQLIHSSSPYLLQHAHNPVDWHFWSDETLQKAKDLNKPILVSIGYSSCHWCHVMEKESFENEEVAKLMNEHFINIKIDREERPDLDIIYMDAVQAMTGSGGWPLNVFLTSDLKPFYGGTYFPPKNAHGRTSWTETLTLINKAYQERKNEIEDQAEKLTQYLINTSNLSKLLSNNNDFEEDIVDKIAKNMLAKADTVWGGFGTAPKFPQSFSILFLLRHFHFTKDQKSLNQATLSLDKMILGGIYDHIGGGFARYSTDERWFAPHFEKMLYDNAMLVSVLSEAYQITKKELYKTTIEQTLKFIEREMMSNEFAFYSALDADSEGVEGKFYTWQKNEIDKTLKEDAAFFCEVYNITEHGNWEETNIPFLQTTLEEIAKNKNIEQIDLTTKISSAINKLLEARDKKIKPLLDDKTLCSWNALMNIAYCKAYAATGNINYKETAIQNMNFLLTNMVDKAKLFHCYKNGKAYIDGFLEDYSYLIWALIHLQEISGNQNYLIKANEFIQTVLADFVDEDSAFFYFTKKDQTDILVRKIDVYDGATPSANAVLCYCLQYLGIIFFHDEYISQSNKMISSIQQATLTHPNSFAVWALNIQQQIQQICEIVVTGEQATSSIDEVLKFYLPNKTLVVSNQKINEKFPLLKDKKITVENLFYLCKNKTCLPPVNSFEKLLHLYNT